MKKTIILISLFLIFFASNAQKVQIGLKGGINVSSLHFSYPISDSYHSKTGLHAGLFARINASKEWAIQPEAFFSSEGAKSESGNYELRINLNYINVPVLLQYLVGKGFRLEGGPQIGFLINSKVESNGMTANTNFNSTTFSIPLGIDYQIDNGLGLDVRYVFGLRDINPGIKSNVFQFGVFYLFGNSKSKDQ